MIKQYFLILITLSFLSCGKSFLDRDPYSYSNKEDAYKSLEALQAALTGCYDGLQDYRYYGRNMYLFTEVYSDNAKLSSTNINYFTSFYSYSVNSDNSELDGFWKQGYKIIARTNNIIDAASRLSNVSYSAKRQVVGEAYAIRALVYFDLVRVFAQTYAIKSGVDSADGSGGHAGIPIVLSPTSKDSIIYPARSSVKKVYAQILEDFSKADTMLIETPTEPYTLSKYSVEALLTRVYLTMGNWYKVYETSMKIFNSNNIDKKYSLIENAEYKDIWSKIYSEESMFSIYMALNDYQGTNSLGYLLYSQKYVDVTEDLYNLFDANDVRKNLYQKGKEIVVKKYPGQSGTIGLDNVPVIRFSEIYYNCAEALVRLGSKAAQDMARGLLDTVMKHTDNTAIAVKLQDNDLLNLILEERRKEFAFEGQRFFDLKRLQASIQRIDCNAPVCSVSYPSYLFALPIPISEINANKNIKQNPGF